MAIRKIIKYPKSSLLQPCIEVQFKDNWFFRDWTQAHLQDLRDTLAAHPNGVALASNQIAAEGWRLFVARPGLGIPEEMYNPSWEPVEDDLMVPTHEGCLSIPELQLYAPRYQSVKVRWQDRNGQGWDKIVDGLAAQIVQHEVEHLDGKLLINYAPKDLALRVRMEAIRNRKAGK